MNGGLQLDNKRATDLSKEIIDHYTTAYDESKRLTGGFGNLERERTQELISRFLPEGKSTVVDIGGASGVYSFYIASFGHNVHLVDIVPRHIEQAKRRSSTQRTPQLSSMRVGDARSLDFPDNFADVIVMHEPLYHLPGKHDRLKAISEARRVLRPAGVLLAFAITRYAGVLYGISKGHIYDPGYMNMTTVEVRTGLRKNPPDWLNTFPNAFFHLPDELKMELEEGGLYCQTVLGIIGPAWLVPDIDEDWNNPAKRQVLIEIARLLETEPILGPRILGVARKPG